nr:MAG TPA: hypothetical protein [Caudoviricetes sp.]
MTVQASLKRYLNGPSLLLISLSVIIMTSMILTKTIRHAKRQLNLLRLTRFNTWTARAF